jgi:hypothetical protein
MKRVASLLLIFAFFSGCNKALVGPSQIENNPKENFEFLWHYISAHYPYFELKKSKYGLDWNDAYLKYEPQIKSEISNSELFIVLATMMNDLHDGHSNLSSPFMIQFFDKQYIDTANFNWNLIVRNYLMTPKSGAQPYYSDGNFAWGMLRNNIGYIRYGSFMNSITNFDNLLKSFDASNAKGLILDIRGNGGGIVDNAVKMAGRFVSSKLYVGYNKVLTSPGIWSEPLEQYINPEGYSYQKPMVLLTDKGTFSAANLITAYLRDQPNVTTLGDSTGGGGALPFDNELPNGWHFRISEVPFFMTDDFSIEEGIAPEKRIIQSKDATLKGKDDLIEKAIDLLK